MCAFICQAGHQTSDVIRLCHVCVLHHSFRSTLISHTPHIGTDESPHPPPPPAHSRGLRVIAGATRAVCVRVVGTDSQWCSGPRSYFKQMSGCTYRTSSGRPERRMKEEACRNSVHCNNTEFIHRAFCIFLFVSGLL